MYVDRGVKTHYSETVTALIQRSGGIGPMMLRQPHYAKATRGANSDSLVIIRQRRTNRIGR